ncbi:MAG: TatD family hydrolase [Acidimicrobiales bacterium]
MSGPSWTDSHCHLQDLKEPFLALERAAEEGVGRVVCVGTGLDSSRRALALARSGGGDAAGRATLGPASTAGTMPLLYATVGLHPHDASSGLAEVEALLAEVVAPAGAARGVPGAVVGVGECGLDYHYDYSPRDAQRDVFAAQVALARRHDLTLVVHTRGAWDDTFDVLASEGAPERTIIHCFTGGPDEARRCLDAGAYLSFSGIVTFKGAPEVREAAALCPLDRTLVETDAPYLAPVPFRGRPNEPAYVSLVGAVIAEVKQLPVELVAEATAASAAEAFALLPSDPVPSDPVPSDPVPSDPVPSDPVPSDPVPSDPV